jgi:hypothetical protein
MTMKKRKYKSKVIKVDNIGVSCYKDFINMKYYSRESFLRKIERQQS